MFANCILFDAFKTKGLEIGDRLRDSFGYDVQSKGSQLLCYQRNNNVFDDVKTPSIIFRELMENDNVSGNSSYMKTEDFSKEFLTDKVLSIIDEIRESFKIGPEQNNKIAIVYEKGLALDIVDRKATNGEVTGRKIVDKKKRSGLDIYDATSNDDKKRPQKKYRDFLFKCP